MEEKKEKGSDVKAEFNESGFITKLVCPHCGSEALQYSHTDDVGTVWYRCKKCHEYCTRPKSKERVELEQTLTEISNIPSQLLSKKKLNQADRLILYCLSENPVLFHDQHKTPYARVNQNGVLITMPIRSRQFKTWLANLMWQREGKAPGTEGLYSAFHVLEAMALFEGKQYYLYNRVALAEDGFWIDMSDNRWRAIKVTSQGWQIITNPPILFKRYSHQLPLPEPKPNGNPWKFLDFVNIPEQNEGDWLLLLCTAISYLVPTIPHVILVLYGIQGSGKTMLFKLLRRLIDPSSVEVLTMPKDEKERVQQLDHHWCAFYDNITHLPTWISDTLCRAATGGGFTKRELYTDDADVIYNFKRCVGLNGINIAAQRGDLLDRSLLIGLKDIPKNRRRTEEEILAEFESCKAEILGGFLDTLVKAIQVYPTIKPRELFRMADFTRWGCAIAVALGRSEEEFIRAYEEKVERQIEEAVHASPLGTVLLDWVDGLTLSKWEGSPSQLFRALNNHAKELGISTRQKSWPKAPHIMVRQLNELAPSLKALGLNVITGVRTGKEGRKIILESSVTSDTSGTYTKTKSDGSDAGDASNTISLDDIKTTFWGDQFYSKHVCCICGYERMTAWKVETFKGSEFWICDDCVREWEKRRAVDG